MSFISAGNAQTINQPGEHPGIHQIESELHRDVKSTPDESISLSEVADFQPRIAKTTTHEVFGYLPYWQYSAYSSLNYQLLTTVAYFSAEITSTGGITNMHDWPASALVNKAHTNGVRVVLVATLFDSGTLATLLGNATYRHDCVMNLLNAVETGNGDGVNIDFEAMPSSQKTNLVSFMQELADSFRVHIPNAHISMATPAVDWNGSWDYNALANICDALFIMGYDYYWSGSSQAGPNSPLTGGSINLTNTVNTYLSKTGNNGAKIVLGVPYYGHDWPTVTGEAYSQTTANAKSVLFSAAVVNAQTYGRRWDATSQTPWYRYYTPNTTNWRQCWYDDSLSIALKYNFAKAKNLQGVGMWALGQDGTRPELWGALTDAFGGQIPPSQPSNLVVRNAGNDAIRIQVTPQSGNRFVIFSSADGVNFDSLATFQFGDTTITSLQTGTIIYVKVKAVNSVGESSFTEVGAAVPSNESASVLIVNGFDRTDGTVNTSDFVRQHGSSVFANGRSFDFASNEAVISGGIQLTGYRIVDWILGEEGTGTSVFTSQEQAKILSFLESGGSLFISGSEIGYDLAGSSASAEDTAFYANYLKAKYIKDDVGSHSAITVSGGIFSEIDNFNFDDGAHGTYDVDYPDGIQPIGGAVRLIDYDGATYETDGCAGIGYEGAFGSSATSGKLVYLAFPFETIYPESARDSVMSRIIAFLDKPSSIEQTIVLPEKFAILPNYPNPANPGTIFPIIFGKNATSAQISIVNLLGEKIFSTHIESADRNRYDFQWNGRTNSGKPAPTGMYLIRISTASESAVRRFTILR